MKNDNVLQLKTELSVQAQASAWLAKLDGNCFSTEDFKAFKLWVNAHPDHRDAFENVSAAWDELNVLTRLPEYGYRSESEATSDKPGWQTLFEHCLR